MKFYLVVSLMLFAVSFSLGGILLLFPEDRALAWSDTCMVWHIACGVVSVSLVLIAVCFRILHLI